MGRGYAAAVTSRWLCSALLCTLLLQGCRAAVQSCTFLGSTDTNWSDGTNWDCAGTPRLPLPAETAVIANSCDLNQDAVVANMVVVVGGQFSAFTSNSLNISNSLTVDPSGVFAWRTGVLRVLGRVDMKHDADVVIDSRVELGSGTWVTVGSPQSDAALRALLTCLPDAD